MNRILRYRFFIYAFGLIGLLSLLIACGTSPTATPQPAPTSMPAASPTAAPTVSTAAPTATPSPAGTVAGQPKYGGILRKPNYGLAYTGGFETLLPGWGPSYTTREVFNAVYDTLVTQDIGLSIQPGLAQSWDLASDGMSVTFHLRQGAKFHNGEEFTADVAKWNLDMNLKPEQAPKIDPRFSGTAYYFDLRPVVGSAEVLDKYTLKLTLKKAFRPFMAWLASGEGFSMLSPKAAAEYGDKLSGMPIGTGPFKFGQYLLDDKLTTTKNENFWDKNRPYLNGITWVFIPDESVRLAMLRTGELDMMDLSPRNVQVASQSPNVKVVAYQSKTVTGLQFRTDLAPWTNRALRQAVAYAVDRDAVIKVLYQSQGQPAYNMETEGLWWSAPDIKPYTYDVQKAKAKMVEAGYPNGISVDMGCTAEETEIVKCEFYQSALKEIGINVNILQTKQLTADLRDGKFGFRIAYRWAVYYGDPDTRLRWAFHSKGPYFYLTHYNNPKVDDLIDQAVQVYDEQKAKDLYRQIIQITADDASWVFVIAEKQFEAISQYVRNFNWYPDDYSRVRDIWLDK